MPVAERDWKELSQPEKVAAVLAAYGVVDVEPDAGAYCYGIHSFLDAKQAADFATAMQKANPTAVLKVVPPSTVLGFFARAPVPVATSGT